MGIPRLLLLKQWLSKPTYLPQSSLTFSINSLFQPRRFLSSTPFEEILKFVKTSPQASVVPLIEKYYQEGTSVAHDELQQIILKLRKQKQFGRALEASEWTGSKSPNQPDFNDVALRLDLICKVHGIDAAEKFFSEVSDHSEKTYGALLNCYVQAGLVDKSLSHFKKMKEMGLAKTHSYNLIMSLCNKTRQSEKVRDFLIEMEDNGIPLDYSSYRTCMKACSLRSDFTGMAKILETMEKQPHISMDWFTYCIVANYFADGGCSEKAIYCLQKAEETVSDNAVGYNYLISTYAKLGDMTQVKSLWEKHKAACKEQNNDDYMVVLSSLVKLDAFQEAESVLKEWISSGNPYDMRVTDVVLAGYTKKGQAEKAENILEGIVREGQMPVLSSWRIISEGYADCQNMEKAMLCMEKALQLGPQHQGWKPKRAVVSSILKWLEDHGNFEQADKFLRSLSTVVPMNRKMYQTLLKTSLRHGGEIDGILQRMSDDGIDLDDETRSIIKGKGSKGRRKGAGSRRGKPVDDVLC